MSRAQSSYCPPRKSLFQHLAIAVKSFHVRLLTKLLGWHCHVAKFPLCKIFSNCFLIFLSTPKWRFALLKSTQTERRRKGTGNRNLDCLSQRFKGRRLQSSLSSVLCRSLRATFDYIKVAKARSSSAPPPACLENRAKLSWELKISREGE